MLLIGMLISNELIVRIGPYTKVLLHNLFLITCCLFCFHFYRLLVCISFVICFPLFHFSRKSFVAVVIDSFHVLFFNAKIYNDKFA